MLENQPGRFGGQESLLSLPELDPWAIQPVS